MTAIERTAWPVFGRQTRNELEECYTLEQKEINFIRDKLRKSSEKKYLSTVQFEKNCYGMALLLKCFQRLGYFPALHTVPNSIASHIAKQMKIKVRIQRAYKDRWMLRRHQSIILEYLKIKPWLDEGKAEALKSAEESAKLHNYPADIINFVIERLIQNRYELPTYNQMDRMVKEARLRTNQCIFDRISDGLSNAVKKSFDLLLKGKGRTPWFRLKEQPQSTTVTHFKILLEHHTWLLSLGSMSHHIENISQIKLKHFIGEARSLDASDMRDINENKRYALIACLIDAMQKQAKDDMVVMFIKTMKRIEGRAKDKLQELREKFKEKTGTLLTLLNDIVFSLGKRTTKKRLRQIRSKVSDHGGRDTVMDECSQAIAIHHDDHLPMMLRPFSSSRRTLFNLLQVLDIQSSTQDDLLIKAKNFISLYANSRCELVPSDIDIGFVPKKWQKFITIKDGVKKFFSRKYLEISIFLSLANELKAADIFVNGSGFYKDFRDQLMPWKECIPLADEYCKNVGIPRKGKDAIKTLRDQLRAKAADVDSRYPTIDELIIEENGRPKLKKRNHTVDEADEHLAMAIKSRMPKRNLIDVLINVHRHTSWASPFGPVSGSEPKLDNPDERYILMTFAYGTGMGPKQTVQHMRHNISAHMLSWANQRHSTTAMQNKAMAKIINLYRRLGITKCWGSGIRASADGTLRKIRSENLTAEHHIRYGSTGGIAYHHIADNYIALFSTFIPCGVWEAVEIIEGLLRNESEIQPKIIHADTQGQSSVVFAVAWLLGIKLMPRIRNWKDLAFYRPSPRTRYKHIDSLFTDSIDWELIERHWQDILQVVISIKQGKISSSALLRKFGSYSKQNKLCLAMRELGYVIRTMFLLEYISDVEVRKEITAETNKVETYNDFSGWLSFGNQHAIVASNDPEEHEKAVKYNDIISNAVMFQNALDMTAVIKQLKFEGYPVTRKGLKGTSPQLRDHLNRFGEYVVDMGIATEDIEAVMDLPELAD